MLEYLSLWSLRIVFIMADLATAWFLASTAELYIAEQVNKLLDSVKGPINRLWFHLFFIYIRY